MPLGQASSALEETDVDTPAAVTFWIVLLPQLATNRLSTESMAIPTGFEIPVDVKNETVPSGAILLIELLAMFD